MGFFCLKACKHFSAWGDLVRSPNIWLKSGVNPIDEKNIALVNQMILQTVFGLLLPCGGKGRNIPCSFLRRVFCLPRSSAPLPCCAQNSNGASGGTHGYFRNPVFRQRHPPTWFLIQNQRQSSQAQRTTLPYS